MNRMFVVRSVLFFPYALIGMNTDPTDLESLSRQLGAPVIRGSSRSSQEISARSPEKSSTQKTQHRKKKSARSPSIKKLLAYAHAHGITAWLDTNDHELLTPYLEAELAANDAIVTQAAGLLDAPDESGKQKLIILLLQLTLRSAQQLCAAEGKESVEVVDKLKKQKKDLKNRYSDLSNEVGIRDRRIRLLENNLKQCHENSEKYRVQVEGFHEKYSKYESFGCELNRLASAYDGLCKEIACSKEKGSEENAS